jgi:Lar family restriction alleviation protein
MIEQCPFCGNTDQKKLVIDVRYRVFSSEFYFVTCLSCGAQGPHACTHEEAVDRWNKGAAK